MSVEPPRVPRRVDTDLDGPQITCLYDMDIPRPDNFNETYLYEGERVPRILREMGC